MDGEQVDDDAGYDQEDRIVDRKYIYGDRVQRGGDAQYQQDVEDIGADGISQGDACLFRLKAGGTMCRLRKPAEVYLDIFRTEVGIVYVC